ncbi:transmembrane protein 272-like [Asterias amurensis]|uniref:transmembrane protein 272-like n=1 Tax=Asterias amurensis TaxID=7602 RepID=UPI003AB512AB
MADAEEGLVKGDTSDEPTTYGSADTGATDKPPPFDAVPGEDPPSYKSVMQELRDAKKTSSGSVDLATKVLTILINTVLFTVLMAVVLAVPIAMVIVGAIHVNDCPVQSLIPVFLIVSGTIYIIKTLLDLCVRVKKQREGQDADFSFNAHNSVSRVFACVLLVFFILGNVWVYGNFKPDEDPTSPSYCHPSVYYFSFWLLTLTYIVLILGCCCACCTVSVVGIGLIT